MKDEAQLRVDERGRIVIPLRFRKALALRDGGRVAFRLDDGDLRLSVQGRKTNRRGKRATKNTDI